jgi:Uma2 family endonuclease
MATIPFAAPSRHVVSVDAFHRMGETGILGPADRVELIDGEIIDMSPIEVLHAAIVARLASYFSQQLGARAIVWCQNPLRLDDISEPEPDIVILRPRADFYTTAHPGPADVLLVIEVADSSLAYDLGTKVPLYARHGIPEVWVIDAATRKTSVFRRPTTRPEAGRPAGSVPAGSVPAGSVPAGSVPAGSVPAGSGYADESSIGPEEAVSCAAVVADGGGRVVVELARLLPAVPLNPGSLNPGSLRQGPSDRGPFDQG